MKLLVERQRHVIYFKVGMFDYCFIGVSDYIFVFDKAFVSRFGIYIVRNVVAGYRLMLCRSFGYMSL